VLIIDKKRSVCSVRLRSLVGATISLWLIFLAGLCGCDGQDWFKNLTEFRDESKNVQISFVNETPVRLIVWWAAFDPLNVQDSDAPPAIVKLELEDNSTDNHTTMGRLFCLRRIDVGGASIKRVAELAQLEDIDPAEISGTISFSFAPAGEPDSDAERVGTAEPISVLLGIDYDCGMLLVFRFRPAPDKPGGFEVVFKALVISEEPE